MNTCKQCIYNCKEASTCNSYESKVDYLKSQLQYATHIEENGLISEISSDLIDEFDLIDGWFKYNDLRVRLVTIHPVHTTTNMEYIDIALKTQKQMTMSM